MVKTPDYCKFGGYSHFDGEILNCLYIKGTFTWSMHTLRWTNFWNTKSADECYKNEQTFERYNICSCPNVHIVQHSLIKFVEYVLHNYVYKCMHYT